MKHKEEAERHFMQKVDIGKLGDRIYEEPYNSLSIGLSGFD